ncbi:dihydrofolate reductase [Propionivibrio sp.]|uniref:dihydrofolate reductase n=1 Tax=Propionivibrio sp. TaxID=2212460 RepID=UPI003BF0309D
MISLIAAVARNRVIGKDNQLLWHLPEDMRHFRETTRGKPVIMGRKTWESLPDSFRPLPGRHNIVVSRNPGYEVPGATLVGSLEEAIGKAGSANEVFVIGGAELYRQALALADRLYLTEIAQDFTGDAFFPEVLDAEWAIISSRPGQPSHSAIAAKSANNPAFDFVIYQRISEKNNHIL